MENGEFFFQGGEGFVDDEYDDRMVPDDDFDFGLQSLPDAFPEINNSS